jgi:hypothetical protein
MSLRLRLDERDQLKSVTGRGADVRLERVDEDHWFLRIGAARGETLAIHLHTAPASPRIRAWFSKATARR